MTASSSDIASAPTPDIPALDFFSLKDKVALVTGGSKGIGATLAVGLADAGASICIIQRDTSNTTTRDTIRSRTGVKCEIIHGDLEKTDTIKGIFQDALNVMGGEIHILVNNGGLLKRCEALEMTGTDFDRVFDVNVKSLFLLSQAAAEHMIPLKRGKIINIASINTFIGTEKLSTYVASKGAVGQLTKALSVEWSKYNIQVNALAPGYIATDLNQSARSDPDTYQWRIQRTPAGRWGEPSDLVGPTILLASQASQFMCGHTVVVDGGILCK